MGHWVGQVAPGTPASNSFPENLARPIIWAEPAVLIPNGQPVAIFCQGAPGAMECQLSLEGSVSALGKAELPQGKRKVKFLLEAVTSRTAGRYSCSCRYGALWSEPSKPLDLMVTGRDPVHPSWAGLSLA